MNKKAGINRTKEDEHECYKKCEARFRRERRKVMGTILIVILILMLIGVLPTWPHSRNWGYYPSDGLGFILIILIILLLLGRI